MDVVLGSKALVEEVYITSCIVVSTPVVCSTADNFGFSLAESVSALLEEVIIFNIVVAEEDTTSCVKVSGLGMLTVIDLVISGTDVMNTSDVATCFDKSLAEFEPTEGEVFGTVAEDEVFDDIVASAGVALGKEGVTAIDVVFDFSLLVNCHTVDLDSSTAGAEVGSLFDVT